MIVDSKNSRKRKRGVLEKPLNMYYKNNQNLFNQWLTRLGYAESTIKSNRLKLGYFFSYLQSLEIHSIYKISTTEVNSYNTLLHSLSLSSAYIGSCILAIRNFSNYIAVTENYKISFTPPKTEKQLTTPRNILSKSEVKTLFNSLENNLIGIRDTAILHLIYSCGLRCEEAVRLQLKDLDYHKQLLYVQPGKTRLGRYVPLPQKVVNGLRDYEQYARPLINPNGIYFLVNHHNNGFTTKIIGRSLTRILENTSITKSISPHSMRHSIATHLLQEGMAIEQIGQFLGHKSLDTTQLYVRMNTEILYETTP